MNGEVRLEHVTFLDQVVVHFDFVNLINFHQVLEKKILTSTMQNNYTCYGRLSEANMML